MIKVLNIIKELRDGDLHLLNSIERGMKKHDLVPFDALLIYSGYTEDDVEFYLNRILKFELIKKKTGRNSSFKLKTSGYDCLALNTLIKANIIEAFGYKLGVGKEADVYSVLLANDKKQAAIKIHRVGRASFYHVKRYRTYIGQRKHISWLYLSRLAAQKEFEALKTLYDAKFPVPEPIFQNRHTIVMSFINNGKLLSELNYLKNPNKVLDKILDFIFLSFKNYDIIHADLSEFNIMMTKKSKFLIFDFPQWISSEHPQYVHYLKRDIVNILDFFRRKFDINIYDNEEIYNKFGL